MWSLILITVYVDIGLLPSLCKYSWDWDWLSMRQNWDAKCFLSEKVCNINHNAILKLWAYIQSKNLTEYFSDITYFLHSFSLWLVYQLVSRHKIEISTGVSNRRNSVQELVAWMMEKLRSQRGRLRKAGDEWWKKAIVILRREEQRGKSAPLFLVYWVFLSLKWDFSESIEMIMFIFYILLVKCITLTDILVLNHSCKPGINPTW